MCGGNSQRMGSDKGLLLHQSKTWAQNAVDTLSSCNMPVLLSVRKEQIPLYAAYFDTGMLLPDADMATGGPAKGILSAHLQHPGESFFVLACDMLNMQAEVIQFLLEKSKEKEGDIFVYTINGNTEPLCGIYTHTALAKINQLYQQQAIKKNSMKYLLLQVNTIYVDVPGNWLPYFKNYNTGNDLVAG
jgi:molybdopterin-guanine dinucleotide biosynthesis protein A